MITITNTAKNFKQMFNLITCGNKYPLFPEFMLDISDQVITVSMPDPSNVAMTNQKHLGFTIDNDSKIPMDNSVINAINVFNDNEVITLQFDGKQIIISSVSDDIKNTITIPGISIERRKIDLVFEENEVVLNRTHHEYCGSVVIDCKHIQKQLKMGSLNEYLENLISIDNGVILSIGDINNFEIASASEITIETQGKANGSYMGAYADVFKTLTGEVTINITEQGLLIVSQKNDQYEVNYLLAPTHKG